MLFRLRSDESGIDCSNKTALFIVLLHIDK